MEEKGTPGSPYWMELQIQWAPGAQEWCLFFREDLRVLHDRLRHIHLMSESKVAWVPGLQSHLCETESCLHFPSMGLEPFSSHPCSQTTWYNKLVSEHRTKTPIFKECVWGCLVALIYYPSYLHVGALEVWNSRPTLAKICETTSQQGNRSGVYTCNPSCQEFIDRRIMVWGWQCVWWQDTTWKNKS
jgi:hypothetical protein